MNNIYTHQEVLLMVNSKFASKDWVKRNENDNDRKFSQKEKLIDACWNGLIPELLPECFIETKQRHLSLLEVNETGSFIDLEFCNAIQEKDKYFSLNPHLFMEVEHPN